MPRRPRALARYRAVTGQRRTVELRDHRGVRIVVDRPRARGQSDDEIALLAVLVDSDGDPQIAALCHEYLAHPRASVTLAHTQQLVADRRPLVGARVLAQVDALTFSRQANAALAPGDQLALTWKEQAA
jgi:hypothetical protein